MKGIKLGWVVLAGAAAILSYYAGKVHRGSEVPTGGSAIRGTINSVQDRTATEDGPVTRLTLTVFDGENNERFLEEIGAVVGKKAVFRVALDSPETP